MKATRSPRCAEITSSRSTAGTQLDVHWGRCPMIQADGAPSALKNAREPPLKAPAPCRKALSKLLPSGGRTPVDAAGFEVRQRHDRAQSSSNRLDQLQRELAVVLEPEHDPVPVR